MNKMDTRLTVPKAELDQAVDMTQTSQTKPGLFGPGFYPVNCITCFLHFGSSRLLWELLTAPVRKIKTCLHVQFSL